MITTLHANETHPDVFLSWPDPDGDGLWDLTGLAMAVAVIRRQTNEVEFVKTAGVLGGDGTGLSNVAIGFTSVELGQLAGELLWVLRVTATSGSDVAVFTTDSKGSLPLLRVLPAPTGP